MIIFNQIDTDPHIKGIIEEDEYEFLHFKQNYFDAVIDIGANFGVFAIFAKMNHPKAKIIALEPDLYCYSYLTTNCDKLNIDVEHLALGDGYDFHAESRVKGELSRNVFTESKGKSSYKFQTITLPKLFESKGISKEDKYFLKIDCEGGERFLLHDSDSEEILKNSEQLVMEVHFRCRDTREFDSFPEWDEYDDWIRSMFDDKWDITYKHSRKHEGHGLYVVKKKDRK